MSYFTISCAFSQILAYCGKKDNGSCNQQDEPPTEEIAQVANNTSKSAVIKYLKNSAFSQILA